MIADHRVVNAVTRSEIDSQLPYAVPAELMIAKVAQLQPIDAPVNGDSCFCITQTALPFEKDISAVWSQIMVNFEHNDYRL